MSASIPQTKLTFPFIIAFLALSSIGRAVDPPPDGGYPNHNTAEGEDALFSVTTGDSNTAIGFNALYSNTTGSGGTGTGYHALFSNTAGYGNTAHGVAALYSNTTGYDNTATGLSALYATTTGVDNTANGTSALYNNTIGSYNTAVGYFALGDNISGGLNTAVGESALRQNARGSNNIALGDSAGFNVFTGSNNIFIGHMGRDGDSGVIRVGSRGIQTSTFIAGISGATVPDGVPVIIGSNGHLGTMTSSERFKEAIKPMDATSEAIFALQPVTFRYKRELDAGGFTQFGLVAEQVEKVDPALVARDEEGKPYTVRYEAVNAMLLNEFLKEHRKVEQQETTINELKVILAQQQKKFESTVAQQQKDIGALKTRLDEQASTIQKVSEQVELSKSMLANR